MKAFMSARSTAQDKPPSSQPAGVAWPDTARAHASLLCAARPNAAATLYALVDCAADDKLHPHLCAEPSASQVTCLFDGTPGQRYATVAPYLFVLHDASPLTARWLQAAEPNHWGVWVVSRQKLDTLKRHLKKFLLVRCGGRKAYFRYYDPRVMAQCLQVLRPGQRGDFFGMNHGGMVDAFLFTTQDRQGGAQLVRYAPVSRNPLRGLLGQYEAQRTAWPWQIPA